MDWSAEMVIATVDGACVSALSEGRDVQKTARGRLRELLGAVRAALRFLGGVERGRPAGLGTPDPVERVWSIPVAWTGPIRSGIVDQQPTVGQHRCR